MEHNSGFVSDTKGAQCETAKVSQESAERQRNPQKTAQIGVCPFSAALVRFQAVQVPIFSGFRLSQRGRRGTAQRGTTS